MTSHQPPIPHSFVGLTAVLQAVPLKGGGPTHTPFGAPTTGVRPRFRQGPVAPPLHAEFEEQWTVGARAHLPGLTQPKAVFFLFTFA